jgi:hypothetical protein
MSGFHLQDVMPIFICLEHDVLNPAGQLAYEEVSEECYRSCSILSSM